MRDPSFYLGVAAIGAGLAAWLAWMFTPVVRKLALRYGAAPPPRARDVHREPVARWGGLAIYAAFILSLVIGALVVRYGFHRPISPQTLTAGVGLILAGSILSLMGAIDDRWELSAGKQILVQILCAMLVLPFGVEIRFVSNPFGGGMLDLQWASYPITILWLVGVANAVNWIDGIDGLAAGVTAISAFTLALMAAWSKQPALTIFAAALFGALLGFLRFNFNPAKIFMGGGAPFVGFMLAGISAVGAFKAPVAVAVAAPILILALPIFDTALVIVKRWRAGRPIYQADKSHLHHRLLERGFSQRQTVLILYGISLSLCMVAFGAFLALSVRG
ncbi:MAG TPA: MraY family glycosyltransferase [Armatimonadota bacterium]|nr:MraY family glycosyltransferase [Armatimonadota bacterium]